MKMNERAGSTKVLHLHGEILKARSRNPNHDVISQDYPTYDVGLEGIQPGDVAPDGYPLRPEIVFFGESVPKIIDAEKLVQECDALVVVGTSLKVYPAANLIWHTMGSHIYYVDRFPEDENGEISFPCRLYKSTATIGVPSVLADLKKKFLEIE